MAGTIMGTFKAQLLTKLQANDTLSDIQVTYGDQAEQLVENASSSET